MKYLTCFKHQINITVVFLSCGSFFKYQSVFWVNGVFECNKFVHKLTLDMIFVVLIVKLYC